MEANSWVSKFTALKALVFTGSFAGRSISQIEQKCLKHFVVKKTWGMWWWEFDKEEPLQEDLVVYEKFMEWRRERLKMTREKERQKQEAAARKAGSSGSGKSVTHSGASYTIPDPTN